MGTYDVLKQVMDERQAQINKHGGVPNDDRNSLSDWIRWMVEHLAFASRDEHTGTRQELVRVAALAVAAIEAYDRNGGFPK